MVLCLAGGLLGRGYRFASFTFLVDEGRLLHGNRSVELQPKVYELLLLLLSRPGEVFSRDDLYSSLWPDVSVSDDSLTQAIRRLRRALDDGTKPARFVETVRSRGYRFVAEVEPIEAEKRPTLDLTLVGRRDLMAQLHETFALARLVTLFGFGGVGKSTIARHFARTWPTGLVSTCELEPDGTGSGSSEQVIAAVANALTLVLGQGRDRAARVGRALSARGRYLLVLDGFETLVEHGPLLADWMLQAPELRILVTSRERLRLTQEHVIAVGPLEQADAHTLFVARAHAQRQGCCEGAEEDVDRIVATLDRLPLALELAAARMTMLSPATLLQKLDARLGLLTDGPRDLPARQRSLRATIAWSWRLMEVWEAEALTQCTVFRGGFTADAAEAVLLLRSGAPDVLSVVGALVDQSMVRAMQTPEGMRFHLFDTVREYAMEQPCALRSQVEARHGAWYAQLAAAMLDRSDEPEVDGRPSELANFICAVERGSVAAGDAAQLALLLADQRRNDAPLAQLCHWAERAIALGEQVSEALHNDALIRHSQLLRDAGRSDEALAVAHRAMDMATARSDRPREAEALSALGSVERELGNVDAARRHLERARELYRATGDVQGEVRSLLRLGLAADQRGGDGGEQHYRTALAMLDGDGNPFMRAMLLLNLGQILVSKGKYSEAAAKLAAAAEANAGRHTRIEAAIKMFMGFLCHRQRQAEKADVLLEQALQINRRTGELGRQAIAERYLAWFALHRGDVEAANRVALASLEHSAGSALSVAGTLLVLGAAALVEGSLERACQNLQEALTIYEELRRAKSRIEVLGWLSAASALQGNPDAEAKLAEARDLDDGKNAYFLAICADFASLRAAREAWQSGDLTAHRRHLMTTRGRLGEELQTELAPLQHAFTNAWRRIDALA